MVNIARKFLIVLNNLHQMRLKLLQKGQFQKTAEGIGDLVSNKIADKVTKISKNSQQYNPRTVTNKNDKEIPKQRHISSEERQKIIGEMRLI